MSAPAPAPTAFTWEPLFLALAVAAAVLYARAARRERVPLWRVGAFAGGLFLIAAALNSPLETLAADYLLVMHLLQNVVIADWAPPLLVLGLTPRMRAEITRVGGRALETVTRPRVALPAWLVGWYAIHFAGFYDAALANPWLLNVEHALLIAIGLVFWWPVIVGRLSPPVAIAYLGAGFVGSAFLGLALTFATSVLYDYYETVPRIWGLSALEDQNYGGVLMSAEQAAIFLVAIGWFLLALLREEEAGGQPARR
ncbi:MAG TPA: cytochrome c oxidase assembly protein [Gaiellaceae bacterium]|nr:cytochrome c oxidase assembly protein [Gaiellaceae bacterium]